MRPTVYFFPSNCHDFSKAELIYHVQDVWDFIIPQATSGGGYNVFYPSVSQSVSPVFLVSATQLKNTQQNFVNFVVMQDIMCRWAYQQEILIQFFFLGVTPFLNLEIWQK